MAANTTITVQIGDVTKTLAEWRMVGARYEEYNQASASFACNVVTPQDADDLWPYKTKLILRCGDTVRFVGYRMKNIRLGSAKTEALQYKFGSIWDYFFDQLVFQKLWSDPAAEGGGSYRSQVVLGQSLAADRQSTDRLTMAAQIKEIVDYAIAASVTEMGAAQLRMDPDILSGSFSGSNTLGWGGLTPIEAVNDMMCSECVRKMLRWVMSSSCWFDYSTDVPTFHAKPRGDLEAITLPFLAGTRTDLHIERRDDLVPTAINLKYRVNTTIDGASFVTITDDVASPIGVTNPSTGVTAADVLAYARRVGSVVQTYDFEGANVTSGQTATLDVMEYDPGSLDFWRVIFPELDDQKTNAPLTGLAVSSVVTPVVDGVDLETYPNIVFGNVPPWIQNAAIVPGTIRASFVYHELAPAGTSGNPANTTVRIGQVPDHRKTASVQFTNLAVRQRQYNSGAVTNSQAEPIPLGLANFIYQTEKVAQYDGHYIFKEVDCSGLVNVGQVLNISGGLAEWSTMKAQIQQVALDFDAGVTEIRFGTARHLGAGDLIERLRSNRGPRMLYLLGGNLANSQSSSQTAVDAGVPAGQNSNGGNNTKSYMLLPSDFPMNVDRKSGVGLDARPASMGITVVPPNPAAGSISALIAQLNGHTAYFVELKVCEDADQWYRMFLCSDRYKK